ncbi:MAG TPA: carboxypeptidase-like regulatory domain-containing protein, partial [Edaphobacter sp.]|nr:carboxypeptidase-like regulatory domain-containing protein [Edaphobacter sp.]
MNKRTTTAFTRRCALILGLVISGILCMSHAPEVWAQALSGLTGHVTDATGAVITDANITVANTATGVVTHAVTSSAGSYQVTGLIPGDYSVSAEASGFKKSVQNSVKIEVGNQATIDLVLAVGRTSETVQADASSIALNTSVPELGTTIEPEVVKALPNEISGRGRQIDSFIFLAPGVQGNSFSHQINGGVNFSSEILFDGIPVTQPETPGYQTLINPPYEMVNEFRVVRSVFSAQYGLAQGAVTYNMASGTNRLHGDAFEINRNSFFDSKGAYAPLQNGHPVTPVNHQNNYGFSLDGPIMIPRVYSGKDRTFFHLSVEFFKQNSQNTAIGTVPTVAEKHGDFSSYRDASGNQIPIFDPLTGAQFPGNVIPASRFSDVSKSLLSSISDPSLSGQFFDQSANAAPVGPILPNIQHSWGYHLDHTLTDRQSLHWSHWRDSDTSTTYYYAPIVPLDNPLQSAQDFPDLGTGFLLNYIYAISNNLVMTAGAGWVGQNNAQNNHLRNISFPGVVAGQVLPNINFSGQFSPTSWGVAGGNVTANNRKLGLTFVNNWLWTRGKQTLNLGVEIRRAYQNDTECLYCGGAMNFSNLSTSNQDGDPNTLSNGSGFASFLLGYVDNADRIFAREMRLRNLLVSPYVQDDIRLTPKLTINAGFRWDIMRPFTENDNNVAFMNPQLPNPGANNLPGAITKLGQCDGCAGFTRADIHWGHV